MKSWSRWENIPSVGEITDAQGAEFQSDFGLGPELEREFENRLTNGGKTSRAETQKRLQAFADYVGRHQDLFNRNPSAGVSRALDDPKAFGLHMFLPIESKPTLSVPKTY